MLIGAQAFQETPRSHAPAIILALIPNLAAWGKLQIDNTLNVAGTSAAALGIDKLSKAGVLYHGLEVLGGGAILGGLMLGAIAAFIIERELVKAAMFTLVAAICTFVGLIHGEAIGFAQSLPVTFSYLMVAGILMASAKFVEVKSTEESQKEMEIPSMISE
jgi:AGZA family xanthine/uracil permease-like MFS transporter